MFDWVKTRYRTLYSKGVHALMLLQDQKIDRHVVVFESDDWGSIRMPSLEALRRLQAQGAHVALPQSYDSLDTLASNDDLELLMEVLSSVKDGKFVKVVSRNTFMSLLRKR